MNNSIHVEVKDDQCDVFLMNLTSRWWRCIFCCMQPNRCYISGNLRWRGQKFLWRINQGDWASEILGHKDSFSSLAFSTDGQLLASGGFHGLVQNRDTSSGNLQCTVEGPRGGIEVMVVAWLVVILLLMVKQSVLVLTMQLRVYGIQKIDVLFWKMKTGRFVCTF